MKDIILHLQNLEIIAIVVPLSLFAVIEGYLMIRSIVNYRKKSKFVKKYGKKDIQILTSDKYGIPVLIKLDGKLTKV